MSHRPNPRHRSHPPLASHDFGRVVAVSLLVALAIPAAVVLASYPALAVGFAGGLLVARGRHVVVSALEAGRHWSTGLQDRYATARR